ncbi:olfactory receptor 14C36-like [Elgaria multicarinata webbii]|uniref:olfactory receptor 14C36-like n=1 Tax=Elgaria multicarinata webbii TaxID=159646 RepID=UPI002FCCFCAE
MYLVVLMGNLLLITVVAVNSNLHTPMYFFLVNLSLIDLGSTSVIIPKSMANALMNTMQISYAECVAQMLLFLFFLSTNTFILTVLAYDRYVAICHPLHFATMMKRTNCIQMAGGAWLAGFLNAALHTGTIFSLPFCSNIIHQFFCDIPHVIRLSCSDSYLNEMWSLAFSVCLGVSCFVFIIMSYVRIFATVFRMPSVERRQKAFSTCIPHLIVVSLLIGTVLFTYLTPNSASSYNLDQALAVLYTVVPPMMNPVIYSMRNQDVKAALWKMLGRGASYHKE